MTNRTSKHDKQTMKFGSSYVTEIRGMKFSRPWCMQKCCELGAKNGSAGSVEQGAVTQEDAETFEKDFQEKFGHVTDLCLILTESGEEREPREESELKEEREPREEREERPER